MMWQIAKTIILCNLDVFKLSNIYISDLVIYIIFRHLLSHLSTREPINPRSIPL